MSKPLKIFITYAHKNSTAKDELIARLAVMEGEKKITFCEDNEIRSGNEWHKDISNTLADSGILLYLVSAASLASKYCNKELAEALNFNVRVIPIILESCNWLNHQLSEFQALPDNGKPINECQPESKGWQNVVDGIRKVVENMQTQVHSFSEKSEKELRAELALQQGNVFIMLGQINNAIERYTHAINLNPNNAASYNNRGGAYRDQGNIDRAIVDFTKAIDLNPKDARTYSNRGGAYSIKGDIDRAIADFTIAINLNSNVAITYYYRGSAYQLKKNFALAIKDLDMAINLKPDFAKVYCDRGMVWLQLRDWKKARTDLATARNMGIDIFVSFRNEYKNVEAYERANRIRLPEDIAAMLTQPRRSRFHKTEKLLSSDGSPLESPGVLNLLEKLRNAGTPLSQYVQTRPTFGIKTGSSGAFVVDSAARDRLIAEHPSSVDVLKPFLIGRDIRRWQVARPDSWLIFTYRGIEINRYPAIQRHLEKYRDSLSKRAGKQEWHELSATKRDANRFAQTKLVCPNSYDHQTFTVDTKGFYCGDTCYLIPTEETWLCGLLNSRVAEWFYSQVSNQLTSDYLKARSGYMQQIPIPDITSTQKSQIGKIVDYLIYLQGQPTTRGVDLAHARDFIMLKYFERIIDGLVYESFLCEELHLGDKQFFKPLFDERLPQIEEMRDDKMSALREIFERLYERTHPVRRNLFFLDSVKPIRIIEDKA